MRSWKKWFIAGGVVSVVWGLLHVAMFLPLAFDPMSMVDTAAIDERGLSDGVTLSDATRIADLLTLLNDALIVYMVGIGLLTVLGARTFATSRLGTGLLVMQVVFWVARIVVPVFQAGRAEVEPSTSMVVLDVVLVATLTVYVVPLVLGRRRETVAATTAPEVVAA